MTNLAGQRAVNGLLKKRIHSRAATVREWFSGKLSATCRAPLRSRLDFQQPAIPERLAGSGITTIATLARIRRAWRYALVLALWIGTNCAALAWIDIYESRRLEAEFGVPAAVIRSYASRTVAVPLVADPKMDGGFARERRSQDGGGSVSATNVCANLWYRYRAPQRFSRARSVPLVVFLHGAGQCGGDNVRQLLTLPSVLCDATGPDERSCAVLAPQCPQPGGWCQKLRGSGIRKNSVARPVVVLNSGESSYYPREADLLDGVVKMIDDVLGDRRIDPNRVYLTGLSMGGYGAWELATRYPRRFAAVVPLCGGGDEGRAGRLVNTPLWAVHGADDAVIPVSQTRHMIAAIREAGGRPRYSELVGVGHNCWDGVYARDSEIVAWMFRQVRKQCSATFATSHQGDSAP